MSNQKKGDIKLTVWVLIVAVLLGGCTSKKNSESGEEVSTDETVEVIVPSNIATEDSTSEAMLSNDEIIGNGGHFVKYEGKIYFRLPCLDSMQSAALWGNYDVISEDNMYEMMVLDLETLDSETLFDDASHGPFAISGGRFILSGGDKNGDQPVRSVALNGSDWQELPGTYLYGALLSGKYYITGGYESSDYSLHFYICGEDGSSREVISSETLYDYVGLCEDQLICITNGEGTHGNLMGYDLETGEETKYGELPEISETLDWPGEPEQLYVEGDDIWVQICAYEGTGHFYTGSTYIKAKCGIPGSLEEVTPEGSLKQEDSECPPAVMPKDGNLIYVEGVPNTAAVDDEGNLGVYDENGTFVIIAAEYGIIEDEIDDTRMRTELCEVIDGDIYLIRNTEQRFPEEDIGWREAYQRLQTSILRIDNENGEWSTIVTASIPF